MRDIPMTDKLRPVVTLLALLLQPAAASAELKFCNQTEVRHSVGVGYKTDAGWTSSGWWNVDPGQCKTPLTGDLEYQVYYYLAEANGRVFADEGYTFCTRSTAFDITGDADCEARGYDLSRFRSIDTGDTDVDFTVYIDDTISRPDPAVLGKKQTVDPANGPGTWGEPYVSASAVFQGCIGDAEVAYCTFHADGARFFVYDDGRTPPAVMRAMRDNLPGAPIEVRGDLEAIYDRSADIVLRQVLARPWNRWDRVLARLQGSWSSLDDPKAGFTILGAELENAYDGQPGGREYLNMRGSCGTFEGSEYLVRRDEETGDTLCYSIENLGDSNLTLMYLPRGNLLEYRRVD
jgi:uncharacterized membrane protein